MAPVQRVKPGDPISASAWNQIVDQFNGGVNNRPPPLLAQFAPTVLVRNDVGVDLDRYDCASLGEPLWELETNGSVDLIFSLEAADPDKPAAILTEPIAHDATNKRFGRVWLYGLAYAFVGPAASTSDLQAAPDPANNRLEPGSGNVRLLAAPSTTVEKLLPVMLGVGGGSSLNLFLFTLTGTIASGTGAATIENMADDEEVDSASVLDPLGHFTGLTTGYRGICIKQDGNYYALGPYVTAVRWDDPNLEFSRGKPSTWVNVDTAEDC